MIVSRLIASQWLSIALVVLSPHFLTAQADEKKTYEVGKDGLVIDGKLTKDDSPIPALKGTPHQLFHIRMAKNQSYLLDLTSQEFDAVLILENLAGKVLAHDNNSGGDLNARVAFVPKEDAVVRVLVAALDKKFGAFGLKVRESVDWHQVAKVAAEKEDVAALQQAFRQILSMQTVDLGAKHWKVTDTRVALQRAELLAKLDADGRRELQESFRLIDTANRAGKSGERIEAVRKALSIRKKLLGDDHFDTAVSLYELGNALILQAEYSAAQPYLEQAVAICEKIVGEDHPSTAQFLDRLAYALSYQDDDAAALPYCERALAIRRRIFGENHLITATSLSSLGSVLSSQAQFAAARPLIERALAIHQKILGENHPFFATSLSNLGGLISDQGDHAAARPYLERALAIRKTVLGETHIDTAASLNRMGHLLVHLADYAAARSYFEQALAIRKKIHGEDHPETANSLSNLGSVLHVQGDRSAARPYYEAALAVRRKVLGERHSETAVSFNNLGGLLMDHGNLPAARLYFEQALAIKKDTLGPNHPNTASSFDNLADLLSRQGDYVAARPFYEQALAIRKQVLGENHPDTARSLNNLGASLTNQGEFPAARLHFDKALALYQKILGENHPDTARSHNNLGHLLRWQGDDAAARPHFEQALIAQRRSLDVSAIALAERQQFAMNKDLRYYLDSYLSLPTNDGVAADDAFAQALSWKGAIAMRQRQLRLVRQTPELAPLVTELQTVCTRLANLSSTSPKPGKSQEVRQQLIDLMQRSEALQIEISTKSARFRSLQEPSHAGPDALRAALPADVALVDFLEYSHSQTDPKNKGKHIGSQRLTAFVVRKDQPIVRTELGPVAAIADQVHAWLQRARQQHPLQGVKGAALEHPGMQLRQLVWQPLEKHLIGAKTVLISPDGVLTLVPFAALPGADPTKFLLEEWMLATVPLPRLLPEILGKASSHFLEAPSLLLLGDVDFGAQANKNEAGTNRSAPRGPGLAWRQLPGTAGEIDSVKQLFHTHFPKGTIHELTSDQATEAAIRSQSGKHRWLHFATHGFFAPPSIVSAAASRNDPKGPADLFGQGDVAGFNPGLLSGIVLAGANQPNEPGRDDGILTALEVAELPLHKTDLVVLSACETGLGMAAGGEGVLGLQRAFQLAGVGSVVSSLWSVSDAATRKLMEKFYENRWKHRLPTGEALRQAQLWMMRDGPSMGFESNLDAPRELAPPFFWAAFVLSGDWR